MVLRCSFETQTATLGATGSVRVQFPTNYDLGAVTLLASPIANFDSAAVRASAATCAACVLCVVLLALCVWLVPSALPDIRAALAFGAQVDACARLCGRRWLWITCSSAST